MTTRTKTLYSIIDIVYSYLKKEWIILLRKMCTGKPNDECYSLLWKAPKGNYEITGIKDNERDKFYDVRRIEDIIQFVHDLNFKERYRHENYERITETFEKTLRQSEDRCLELFEKIKKLQEGEIENETDRIKIF